VAVDPAAGTVYVTNYGGTVSVIDAATNTVTATIAVGTDPQGVAVDPAAGTVYVANSGAGTVSVINAATRTVTATIAVGTDPKGVAVDPATGTVYVTKYGDAVSVIDAATNTVTATVPVDSEPVGVAADPSTHAAYVISYAYVRDHDLPGTVSVISAARPAPVITMTSSQDPSTFGQKVTFTATIAPADGGTTTFSSGFTVLCGAVSVTHAGGRTYKARCATTALPAGFATITAAYSGDTRYAASDGTLTQTVARARTALTARFRTAHQELILLATLTASGRRLSGQPVSFSTGNTQLCTPDSSTRGVATCTLTAPQTLLAEQDHDPILASYPGTTSYQPSSATMSPP
jgi:YVTN family beta-propeller protein